jgi:3-oxosteroid 1-dehydrogenase
MHETDDTAISRKGVSRRDFVTGAAVGLAGIAAVGLTGCAKESGGDSAAEKWDMETDFVQIGAGCGLIAGAYAAEEGDEVIILEKRAAIGGNTALSGGILWLPMNGVGDGGKDDTFEKSLAYLKRCRDDQPIEDAVLEAFIQGNDEMIQFAEEKTGLISYEFVWFADYHPEWEGGMRWGRSVLLIKEGASQTDFVRNAGNMLSSFADACTANGAQLLVSTPAKHLLYRMQENGVPEVIGVEAEDVDGNKIRIKARKGVLLSAGGFGQNSVWKSTYLRGQTKYSASQLGQDGDGQRMAMEIGAEMRNMHSCWGHTCYTAFAEESIAKGGIAIHTFDYHKRGAILVNRYGKRFCNEASDYASQWRTNFAWENWGDNRYANIPSWLICDQAMVDTYGIDPTGHTDLFKPGEVPDYFIKADTLEELATKAGIDPAGLVPEVARFNKFVANLKDEDFHRGDSFLDWKMFTAGTPEDPSATLGPISTPPYYAAEIGLIDIGTCGGPRVNENAQVYHVSGEIIPRLYAAGNNAGSVTGQYAGAGGTCGPALKFSYIAAKHVHALEPWA